MINKTLSAVTTTVRDRMPQQCRKWVRNGDCYLHQAFMLQNCRKSCMAGGYVDGGYNCTLKCSLIAEGAQAHACSRFILNQTQVIIPKLAFPFDSLGSRETDTSCITGHLKSCPLRNPLKRTFPLTGHLSQPATSMIVITPRTL